MRKLMFALALVLPLNQAVASAPAVSLTSTQATALASKAVAIAAQQGYKITATTVDPDGVILATVKGDEARGATPRTSFKKAFTAITARQHTSDFLTETFKQGPAYLEKFLVSTLGGPQDNIILLGGGVLIRNQGTTIGAIGISGAPGGHLDHNIALAAIKDQGL